MLNKQYFYLMLICSFCCLQASSLQKPTRTSSVVIQPGSTIHMTNYVNRNDVSLRTKSNLKSNLKGKLNQEGLTQEQRGLSQNQTTSTDVRASATNVNKNQTWNDFYEQQKKNGLESANDFISWINNHKPVTACVAIASCYSCIVYQIYTANLIIFDPLAWSCWKSEKSFEELLAMPRAALESDLLHTFQNRYIHPTNPTDFIYSLVQSSISLEKEIQTINQQIRRYEWIVKCYSSRFFFINAKSIEVLREKKERLLFIKHIFASWCADYKMEKNNL